MFRIANLTPFEIASAAQFDPDGNELWVVLAKATYKICSDNKIELNDIREKVNLIPQYEAAAGRSSLKRDCEMLPHHIGTDITLNATAYASNSGGSEMVGVSVAVANLQYSLLAIGDRVWKKSTFGRLTPSSPQPFSEKKIRWEDAFGGGHCEGGEAILFKFNPAGKGFYATAEEAEGAPLPSLEQAQERIVRWSDRPSPAGLGALPPTWAPRIGFAGTYDTTWEKTRAPLLATDHNPLFYRSCLPGLHSPRPLLGGEKVTLKNLTPERHLEFELPRVSIVFRTSLKGDLYSQDGQMDRVIIEPDERRLVIVWRAALRVGAALKHVESTTVSLKPRVRRQAIYAR